MPYFDLKDVGLRSPSWIKCKLSQRLSAINTVSLVALAFILSEISREHFCPPSPFLQCALMANPSTVHVFTACKNVVRNKWRWDITARSLIKCNTTHLSFQRLLSFLEGTCWTWFSEREKQVSSFPFLPLKTTYPWIRKMLLISPLPLHIQRPLILFFCQLLITI